MVAGTKRPTKPEAERMQLIKEQAWCIPCILNRTPNRPHTTVQHISRGYKRSGQRQSYGCCHWHHLGTVAMHKTKFDMQKIFGASIANGRHEYEATWGREEDLVVLQDFIIELFEKMPWQQYHLPAYVQAEVTRLWHTLRGMDESEYG